MRAILSCSFGKDSLATLLTLIENKEPLNAVVFFDTGKEFDCIYEIRDRVRKILEKNNIEYIEVKPKYSFDYYAFEKEVKGKNGLHNGYSWCGGGCRWLTSYKKTALDKITKQYDVCYLGIAYDEPKRVERLKGTNKVAYLYDKKISEKEALEICYKNGFEYKENGVRLYDILDRVSCYCCANKNKKELENYKKYLPQYVERIKDMQKKTDRPFKKGFVL